MATIFNGHIQVLILENTGEVPTIPTPPETTPDDPAWVAGSDILIGEFAINKVDGKVWVRAANGIIPLEFTQDQRDAITRANSPSELNPFATMADIPLVEVPNLAQVLAVSGATGGQNLRSDNSKAILQLVDVWAKTYFTNGAYTSSSFHNGTQAVYRFQKVGGVDTYLFLSEGGATLLHPTVITLSAPEIDFQTNRLRNVPEAIVEDEPINKGQLDAVLLNKADLVGGFVPQSQLPSYVDDILEYADLATFPVGGEIGKIYIAIDTGKQYRWTGSMYAAVTNGFIGSTNDVPEGINNLYFTYARVRNTVLTGLSIVTIAAITAADSVLSALGKLQAQIDYLISALGSKRNNIITINNQSASYILELTDADNVLIEMELAADGEITIPTNTSVPFAVGTEIQITQNDTGRVTIVPDGAVTLNSVDDFTQLAKKYSLAKLIKRGANEWYLFGDLVLKINIGNMPGLAAWYKADAGVILSGSNVTEWQDQSGNNLHLYQADATHQPTFVANSVNGMPSLRFYDATMRLNAVQNGFGEMTVIVVCKQVVQRSCYILSGTDSGVLLLAQYGANFYVGFQACANAMTNGEWYVRAGQAGVGVTKWFSNGVNIQSSGSSAQHDNFYILGGNTSSSVEWFDGNIAEVFLFDEILTQENLDLVHTYINDKYAVY